MIWQGRLPGMFALAAVLSLLLKPVFCEALHAIDDMDHAGHIYHDQDDSPGIETLEHCCGGHEPGPEFTQAKVVSVNQDLHSSFLSVVLVPGWQFSCKQVDSSFSVFIRPGGISQGTVRAQLCCWLI